MRFLFLVLLLLGPAAPAIACSTFCVEGASGPLFGKNYDWNVEEGYLVVNRAGVLKRALLDEAPAEWTARHGSITFNQYGREFPNGGMNTEGLVVELMWLDGSVYPEPDPRGAVGVLQWIQYQLDTAASVEEVLASDTRVRIDGRTPLHYLIADATGDVATVEFLDGRMVSHQGDALPSPVLTNDRYDRSLRFLESHEGFGGTQRAGRGSGSLDRFVRASAAVATLEPGDATVETAFDILGSVAQGNATVWSIVYDIRGRVVHYRTLESPDRRYVRMQALDFACDALPLSIDLDAGGTGDMTDLLAPLDRATNRDLIRSSYAKTRHVGPVSDEALDRVASYPDRMECASAN